jgi:hypothetical protein
VIDGDGTDRLELAAEARALDTVPLPFRAGDEHDIDGVPVGPQISLLWFPADEGVEPRLLVRRTIEK